MAMFMAEWKQRQRDFISALEEERRKIQMFSRELPLCLQLLNEAIDGLQRRMEGDEAFCEKGASSDCKRDWLRSAQLWSPAAADELPAEGGTLKRPVAVNVRRVGRAFQPFERNKMMPAGPAIGRDGGGDVEKKEVEEGQSQAAGQSNRKQRRCWSPGLHRKFLNALEQLGGSHAATPKQIREMMMVDGLTNDEVKSHLQKYRLHMRRPVVTVQSSSSNSTQNQPHFVLVGSIWVPPHEYVAKAAAAAAAATTQPAEGSSAALNGVHSPVASLPLEFGLEEEQPNKKQQTKKAPVMSFQSQQRCSQDDDSLVDDAATTSNSSSTSFSSQTTSVSPPL